MNPQWLLWLGVLGFMCGILYTLISIARVSNISGNKDMMSAILTIVMVNGALCLTLAGTGYFSVNTIPILKRPYIMIVLHLTLIFATIGFGISTLRQLGIDPTTLKPTTKPASGPAPAATGSDALQTAIGIGSTGFALSLVSIGVLVYLWRQGKFN
jgi:hypothetical protein